jgi:hypothetical protein
LEFRVFVQVFAAEPAEDADRQNAAQGRRDGDRQQVEEFQMSAIEGVAAEHRHQ